MRTQWLRLANKFGVGEKAAETVWLDLAAAYGEDGRFYHNLNHIQHMLNIADQLQDVATDFRAVQLAIWFHDVVYDPRQSDNEAQSAATAQRALHPLGVPQATLNTVSDLILATQTHKANATDPNIFVILDADLAILAAPPEQYDAYARAIRREYSFVPDDAYQTGRTAVLRRFLARTPFYFTEWMRGWGETAVRQNLTRELQRLEK
ncbi:COG4339 metal-dependent phosphohydrolase, HD superfamily [hydrothermal vent metagenome]|uniref:COG4339 metal-dependent phosphohydrolase, HD superfamily n=1 Tax=hydrothermal vent metagenome TaxID=652676 RepID=A0A3B0VTR5_9ZZZZ